LFACTAFTDGSLWRQQTSFSVTCQFWHRKEAEVLIQLFQNKALIGCGWSAPRSGRFASSKDPGSVYRRQGERRDRSGRAWEISLPLGFGPRTVQPLASRNKDYAIPHCETRPEYLFVLYTNCGLQILIQYQFILNFWWKKLKWSRFSCEYLCFPIAPTLHTHLRLHVALIGRKNGRSLRTFQNKKCYFPYSSLRALRNGLQMHSVMDYVFV